MKYPEGLVYEYGAKAGILMYVAKELPDIPQAPMVVSNKGETTKAFLARIEDLPFRRPWLVRSSAVAELEGYEGEFPTLETYGGDLVTRIEQVRTSPKRLKEQGIGLDLPDEINIIVAEKAKSDHTGTLIKHPNVPDYYLFALTPKEKHFFFGAGRFAYSQTPERGVEMLKWFTNWFYQSDAPQVEDQLAVAASWHDRIAALPEMDPNWAYQLEFGLNPLTLFQIRPFKPVERPEFSVPDGEEVDFDIIRPLVIGITPPEGVVARARRFEMYDNLPREGEPLVVVDRLRAARHAKHLTNHQANLFTEAFGFLQHDDVAAMRRARVTALYPPGGDGPIGVHQGDWVSIISDGNNINVQKVDSPK